MNTLKSKTLALLTSAAVLALAATSAQAHLVTIGYIDNGNATITLYGEHWHGDLTSPYSANGGLHISDGTTTVTTPWVGVINNVSVSGMNFTGWGPTNTGVSNSYQDWMFTSPVAVGNGTYSFYTGPNCCVDEMDFGPVSLTLSGITSVPPGIGGVPEPAAWSMMIMGFGLAGAAMRRRNAVAHAAA